MIGANKLVLSQESLRLAVQEYLDKRVTPHVFVTAVSVENSGSYGSSSAKFEVCFAGSETHVDPTTIAPATAAING